MTEKRFAWVTAAVPPPAPQNVRLLAVCEWTMPEGCPTPELEVAAEGWFRLYHDGRLFGTTNGRGSNCRFYVEHFPLPAAEPGSRHTLALELLSPLKGCFNCVPAGCAFAVRFPAGIGTTPWRAIWSEAWRNSPVFFTPQTGFMEFADWRREPPDWESGSGTQTWPPAMPFTNPKLPLDVRIPLLPEVELPPAAPPLLREIDSAPLPSDPNPGAKLARCVLSDRPERFRRFEALPRPGTHTAVIAPGAPVLLLFDFGVDCIGRFELELEAPPGTVAWLSFGEELYRGHVRTEFPEPRYRFTDGAILRGGGETIGNRFGERGGRYVQVVLSQFNSAVTIRRVHFLERRYPWKRRGSFSASDDRLTRLHQLCRTTVEKCTTDVFLDCPWREHTFWGNDLLVSGPVSMALSGGAPLHRRALELLFSQQTTEGWIPSVCPAPQRDRGKPLVLPAANLFLFRVVEEFWLRTGDTALLADALPPLRRVLDAVESSRDEAGIVAAPPEFWNFYDWSFELSGYSFNGVKEAMFQLLYFDALGIWLRLAPAAGLESGGIAQRREKTREALRAFLGQEGCIVDPVKHDGVPTTVRSRLSQALALLAGFGSGAERAAMLRALTAEEFLPPELFLQHFVLQALGEAGRTTDALAVIRNLWGSCLDHGAPTVPEAGVVQCGTAAFRESGSLCHAFSTAPVLFFERFLLGIRPLTPGFGTFLFAPQPGDLNWVKGEIPTPQGNIRVKWTRSAGELAVELQIPAGCEAAVAGECRLRPAGKHRFSFPVTPHSAEFPASGN
ncbi:family 78 glycoside hydrolase catalytic domain [uncultured Victivallis sp.]|mgnify:CR=1 FL=1|uniref:family 78 glycoside hydrolase catalytic domain n=1 Tax=uncultured Victivallis sp. TaxID=354118 RepID=UPI0025F2A183|nr:family 78 glycoside hydrolase catalytic domain [uncultured Victivallis sp.]